jgi:serine/threonine protein kinase
MPLEPGARLGPYEVLGLAGAGGMGEVYRARDSRLHRTVAIKVASRDTDADPQVRARFQREAQAIAALNHPHICAIHDVATFEGHDLIVMEFLEGETLERRLRRGPLPTEQLFTIAMAMADALAAAHRAGIVHRDLKPSNVMLTRGGVKLLDFGIAKQREIPAEESTPSMAATATALGTAEGKLIGTVPYMAPEQLEMRAVDARTDIFAFGCVLYEMTTGQPAFAGASTAALVAAILSDARPVVARKTDRVVPRGLDRIITACLARDPDHRCQHASDVLQALRWAHEDLTDSAGQSTVPAASRHWRVHAAWASALLAAVITATWLSPRTVSEPLPPPNAVPVVVLMDSPLPGRVYDPRTRAEGGTNADDVTDLLRDLPIAIRKENTSAVWHREEQVVGENPDVIVAHLSCLLDARVGEGQTAIAEHLRDLAEHRLLVFLAYVAARNPRTRFLVYSRSGFQAHGGEDPWVATQVARLPVLRDRIQAFIVPGGPEQATFRDPHTAQLLRARVARLLGKDTSAAVPAAIGGGK